MSHEREVETRAEGSSRASEHGRTLETELRVRQKEST